MQLLNTLYVTLQESYLHLENDTLRLEIGHETKLRVPLHHLGSVVCFGHINISLPLMHRLAEEGISLVLLDENGQGICIGCFGQAPKAVPGTTATFSCSRSRRANASEVMPNFLMLGNT